VKLTTDTPHATDSGTTFTAPAGWTLLKSGAGAMLTGPESDLRVAILDASEPTADEAVAAGWRTLRPDFKRPLRLKSARPGRHGWDARQKYEYETSPDERLVVYANAFRHGTKWTVHLVEGGEGSFEKRLAQVLLIADTLRPEGYVRESFAGQKAHELDADRIKAITRAVDKMRELAAIPGVGLALVQHGKVVYEGGLGVREQGRPEKVTAKTLFMIASNTKALTTLLLAKLVDDKKMDWKTPVTTYLPSFKLGDAETTKKVLVEHLVCACTGMPRQDFEWLFEFEKQSPKSVMESLGTMQPTTKFGETFQYSNALAAAAGFVAGHVVSPDKELGAAYDEAMQARVFGLLGMSDTTFEFVRALRGEHATAYDDDIDGTMAPAVMDLNKSVVPWRPAVGAWSSVHDVAKYVTMELANGKLPDGETYVGEEALLARRKPQVSMGEFATYGMALVVENEWGVPIVHHGGDMIGFHSDMFWIPEADVGGVILGSGPAWLMTRPFIRKMLEVLFDGKAEAEDDAAARIAAYKADILAERKRLSIPPDPLVVSKLAKKYRNAALGDIVVAASGAVRTFDFGGWKTPVASRKNDDGTLSLVAIAPGAPADTRTFVVGQKDGKRALVLRDRQHEYVFIAAE
jgi:CubicO group peptidase (beta-lactamase class C family)